jgi:glycosyltransferase involved in cell wall biosynthesis
MAGGAAANSEALENLKRAGFPKNRPVERIFWGITTDMFKPMDGPDLKKEPGLDCEHIVGFVGRHVPEKAH